MKAAEAAPASWARRCACALRVMAAALGCALAHHSAIWALTFIHQGWDLHQVPLPVIGDLVGVLLWLLTIPQRRAG